MKVSFRALKDKRNENKEEGQSLSLFSALPLYV